jgi:hypothetical protein
MASRVAVRLAMPGARSALEKVKAVPLTSPPRNNGRQIQALFLCRPIAPGGQQSCPQLGLLSDTAS